MNWSCTLFVISKHTYMYIDVYIICVSWVLTYVWLYIPCIMYKAQHHIPAMHSYYCLHLFLSSLFSAVYYYYPSKYLGLDLVLIFLYLFVDYTRLLLGKFLNFVILLCFVHSVFFISFCYSFPSLSIP